MTYFGVLTLFILPPLLVLLVWEPRALWQTLRQGERPSRDMLLPYWIVLAHVALALIYTTPWDNYLVATGVWYYDPALVTGITLGYVPIEEYTFFIVQTLLTGLWVLWVQRRLSAQRPKFKENPSLRWVTSLGIFGLWLISTVLFFAGWQAGTYLTLILSWALVPVLIQVAFGADILHRRWRELVIGVGAPTLYLWLVDAIAIRSGTWTIDPAQTTGILLGSLPMEEMVFFFMTNLIIVFGMTLMLAEESQMRLRQLIARWQNWLANRRTIRFPGRDSSRRKAALKVTLGIWLLALIATPISLWLFGDGAFPGMATLGVLAQLGAVLLAVSLAWSWKRILGTLAVIAIFTWTVEWLGATYGLIFSHYDYTQAMQPQLAGVPLIIPLAWAMMLLPTWAVAQAILRRYRSRLGRAYTLFFAVLSGLAFTAWDLYLDPQMVSRGLWTWDNPVGLFGIPLANFAGWFLVSTLLTLIIRPRELPVAPLLLIYTLTWLFQAVGLGMFWGQAGPALTGFLGMGLFCLWAWRQLEQPWQDVLAWMPFVSQVGRASLSDQTSPSAILEHD